MQHRNDFILNIFLVLILDDLNLFYQFVEADNEKGVPYDRNNRAIAYQRSKGITATMAFGSRRDADAIGYEWINHSLYPSTLVAQDQRVLVGGNNPECTQPYSSSLLNISAMSFGALSDRAILALSAGAKLGGFSHNTGEGGISEYHKEGKFKILPDIFANLTRSLSRFTH